MTLKNQDFAALIESQIGVWQGQIKEHQERLSQAGRKVAPTTRRPWPECARTPSRPASSC